MGDEKNPEDLYLVELYKAYDYCTTEFDKSLTYVSSGILAVSFAFIEKIVPLKSAVSKGYLITGWYLLGIAIFLSVVAHYVNIILLRKIISRRNAQTEMERKKMENRSEVMIQIFNVLTLVLIAIGSWLIISFIKINIK
jgi:NADH:ubiquinone oxidoreductase subunit 2 (subunit N)